MDFWVYHTEIWTKTILCDKLEAWVLPRLESEVED